MLGVICRCQNRGVTVQGAVSAAAAIAIAQAQKAKWPLPQTLLMQCPANMRRQATAPFMISSDSLPSNFFQHVLSTPSARVSYEFIFQALDISSLQRQCAITAQASSQNHDSQVEPPITDEETSCAASFLWWPQHLEPLKSPWEIAKESTNCIRAETEQQGGLVFWARMHASKTLPEMAAAQSPPYTPPYTVRSLPSEVYPSHTSMFISS